MEFAALIDELRDAGVTHAYAEFSGSGDEGWIDAVEVHRGSDTVASGSERGSQASVGRKGDQALVDLVIEFVDAQILEHIAGYENNEGGQATVHINVDTAFAEFNYSYNTMETEPAPWEVTLNGVRSGEADRARAIAAIEAVVESEETEVDGWTPAQMADAVLEALDRHEGGS